MFLRVQFKIGFKIFHTNLKIFLIFSMNILTYLKLLQILCNKTAKIITFLTNQNFFRFIEQSPKPLQLE